MPVNTRSAASSRASSSSPLSANVAKQGDGKTDNNDSSSSSSLSSTEEQRNYQFVQLDPVTEEGSINSGGQRRQKMPSREATNNVNTVTNAGDEKNGATDILTDSAKRRKPPPPPPPPRHSGSSLGSSSGQRQQRQPDPRCQPQQQQPEQDQNRPNEKQRGDEAHNDLTAKLRNKTLTIRCRGGDTVQIFIPSNKQHQTMSSADLASCIAHAALSPSRVEDFMKQNFRENDDDDCNKKWSLLIAGLFREEDRVFIPLTQILSDPTFYDKDDVFCVSRPQVVNRRPDNDEAQKKNNDNKSVLKTLLKRVNSCKWTIVITVASAMMAIRYRNVICNVDWWGHFLFALFNSLFHAAMTFFEFVDTTFVGFPLRELYRNGPFMIGWEGAPLEQICAQLTHMGDESFWTRNLEECERIYHAKERALMHIQKPIVYATVLYLIFSAHKSLVKTRAIRNQNRPSEDMVETYQAFNMLMRQLKRGMAPTTKSK